MSAHARPPALSKTQVHSSKKVREVLRYLGEEYLDKVRMASTGLSRTEGPAQTESVGLGPLFAEAEDWHEMRRFRLRTLKEKVNI
jgi:hypothetical protein